MQPNYDAADLHDAVQAKKPWFDWNEDDGFYEIYVYSPHDGHVVLSIPVTQLGYERVNDLVNSLLQVRDYMRERIAPDGEICYNVYSHNDVGKNEQPFSGSSGPGHSEGNRPSGHSGTETGCACDEAA